jgi:hypothetical protein
MLRQNTIVTYHQKKVIVRRVKRRGGLKGKTNKNKL